jgi:hypothetical protein
MASSSFMSLPFYEYDFNYDSEYGIPTDDDYRYDYDDYEYGEYDFVDEGYEDDTNYLKEHQGIIYDNIRAIILFDSQPRTIIMPNVFFGN